MKFIVGYMKFIVGAVFAILLFALVPIFAHWQWDTICALEIVIISSLIASNYIILPEKGKHQIHHKAHK